MDQDKRVDIVKEAILLELKGKALYESVTKAATVDGVRELFSMLVREEESHIRILNKQYSNLIKGEDFDASELERSGGTVTAMVITDAVVKEISGAGYEAAVISAALEFEKNAVKYYSENAEKAKSEDEKKLYKWFTKWEQTHMMMLAKLDNDIKEQIWYDNQFWPLD